MAVYDLDQQGYTGLSWLNGGLQRVGKLVDAEGEEPLELAGVGGIAGLFLKVAQQLEQAANRKEDAT